MATKSTKTTATTKPAPEPVVAAPAAAARPHSMPRRLLNIPASRTDTAGVETAVTAVPLK
jgi:hypothetical protein